MKDELASAFPGENDSDATPKANGRIALIIQECIGRPDCCLVQKMASLAYLHKQFGYTPVVLLVDMQFHHDLDVQLSADVADMTQNVNAPLSPLVPEFIVSFLRLLTFWVSVLASQSSSNCPSCSGKLTSKKHFLKSVELYAPQTRKSRCPTKSD